MPISLEAAKRHVVECTKKLAASGQRKFWPRYLYHTTHVDNAVDIVINKQLNCRNSVEIFHDAANQGALGAYEGSHDFARLYFRPKNGFHLRTEGIKHLRDGYLTSAHMSMPVIFLFDFAKVITLPDAVFSKGNVQRSHEFLTGDENFSSIDFDSVYHDSGVTPDNRDYIQNCRMAEVGVKNSVPLDENLTVIAFRTKWDLETFIYKLKLRGHACGYRTAVEQIRTSLFFHWGMYISDISLVKENIKLTFNLPRSQPIDSIYKLYVSQISSIEPNKYYDGKLELKNPILSIGPYHNDPNAIWDIKIEDSLAFLGPLGNSESQVFG